MIALESQVTDHKNADQHSMHLILHHGSGHLAGDCPTKCAVISGSFLRLSIFLVGVLPSPLHNVIPIAVLGGVGDAV